MNLYASQMNGTMNQSTPFILFPVPKLRTLESLYMTIESQNCSLTNATAGGIKKTVVCTTTYVYRWKQWYTYLPLMVQIASSGLCYYFARLACKLCMQRISFSIPLSLATPLSVAVIITVSAHVVLFNILLHIICLWSCITNSFNV